MSGVWAKISEQKLQKVAINLFREGEEEMEVERCYLLHNDPLHSSSFKQDRRREGRKEGRRVLTEGKVTTTTGANKYATAPKQIFYYIP